MSAHSAAGGSARSSLSGLRLYDHLPPRPAPDLDRALDAVERCVTRFGVNRTSMTDIAREMGVARTTLYRQVRSLEEALALMASRRFHRFLDALVELAADGIGPETFVQLIVRTVRAALDEPLLQRILNDEPALLGEYLSDGSLTALAAQITELLTPVVDAAMASGVIRATESTQAAGWIVRIVLGLGIFPPPDDALDETVRFVLLPMLAPAD